jgi:hypothetical protein
MVDQFREELVEIEKYLSNSMRTSECLKYQDMQPCRVAEQISRELMRQRFIWLGKETYVPNKMVAHIRTYDPDKLAALRSIFNSPVLINLLTQFIAGYGFKLFDPIEIEVVEFYSGGLDVAGEDRCRVEFCWSLPHSFVPEAVKTTTA